MTETKTPSLNPMKRARVRAACRLEALKLLLPDDEHLNRADAYACLVIIESAIDDLLDLHRRMSMEGRVGKRLVLAQEREHLL